MAETTAIDPDGEGPQPPAGAPLGGVFARLQVYEPSFTPTERRIAGSLRASGRELVGLSIEDLAERVGVSTASVVRFCRRLGYRGLRELMLAFAAEVRGDSGAGAPPIVPGDDLKAIVRKVTFAAQQALAASAEVLDEGALARAITALTSAGRVQLFGVGGSAAMAQDAYYRFARVGLPVAVSTDAHLQSVVAALLKPGDVAFVISHTGRSVEPVDVLQAAKRVGVTTILLTSFANTPAARWADVVLLTAPVATAPWEGMAPLRVAQLTVIDMICVAIAGRDDAALATRMPPGGNRVHSSSDRGPAESTSGNPAAKGVPDQRHVTIEGVLNARHLGGFQLPDGGRTPPIVIRSGMLWKITPAGIAQLQELGVSDVVDLRRDDDCLNWPAPDLERAGIAVIRAPMLTIGDRSAPDLDDRAGWIAHYQSWLEGGQSAMRTLIETILNAEGAVLMHCVLGEDRTGIASALLLDLLGVDEAEIIQDYRMSPNGPGWEFLVSALLDRVRERWGSAAAYFVDAGAGRLTLSRARARLEGRPIY